MSEPAAATILGRAIGDTTFIKKVFAALFAETSVNDKAVLAKLISNAKHQTPFQQQQADQERLIQESSRNNNSSPHHDPIGSYFFQKMSSLDAATASSNFSLIFSACPLSIDATFREAIEDAARIVCRLAIVARHPSAFEKLIIAETRGPSNFLAALFLLRLGGSIVGAPGASVLITPLFESRDDLASAPSMMHQLLLNNIVRIHVQTTGILLIMVAKSDTTRLSGPGVQGAQEQCYSSILALQPASYGGGFEVAVMLGGGDDQMRGGGRIVESPNVVLASAARAGVNRACRLALTVQGFQMQLLFGATPLAQYFIEGFAAQSILANAKIVGLLPWRPISPCVNLPAAVAQTSAFFNRAMKEYERAVGSDHIGDARRQTIVDYFTSGIPAEVIGLANKSSRPGARSSIKAIDPLQGRAISLDQHSKHDGAYLTSTLGLRDALEAMFMECRVGKPEKAEGGEPLSALRHAFLANKSFRDFVRLQSVVLFQKDYTGAWRMRGGPPRDERERAELVAAFNVADGQRATPRQFLAYLEDCDTREAALLVNAITGHRAQDRSPLTAPLLSGWPTMAKPMLERAQQCKLARYIELLSIELLKRSAADGKPFLKALAYSAYCGSNFMFSSPSFNISITSPEKEAHLREGLKPFLDKQVAVPEWWVRAAKSNLFRTQKSKL